MRMKNIFFAVFMVCFISFSIFAEEIQEKQKTQGEFAVQLCKALGMEVPAENCISQLESRGIVPEGGWQASKPINNAEVAALMTKALGMEDKIEKRVTAEVDAAYRNKATIIKLEGKVEVKIGDKGGWAAAQEGMKLTQNDSVKTGPKSYADLKLGVIAGIKIRENTELRLSELSSNPDGAENVTLYLDLGEVLVDARGIKKGSDFQVHTPTTVAAVRGTIYNVKVSEEGKTEIKEPEIVGNKSL